MLLAWRDSTIDVDLRLVPEQDLLLRAIPRLKEVLQLNVELDPAQRGVAERHVDRDGDIMWSRGQRSYSLTVTTNPKSLP